MLPPLVLVFLPRLLTAEAIPEVSFAPLVGLDCLDLLVTDPSPFSRPTTGGTSLEGFAGVPGIEELLPPSSSSSSSDNSRFGIVTGSSMSGGSWTGELTGLIGIVSRQRNELLPVVLLAEVTGTVGVATGSKSGSGFLASLATASLFHFLPNPMDSTTVLFGTGVALIEGPTLGFGDLLAGSVSTKLPTVGNPGESGIGDKAGEEGADPAGLHVAVVPEPELEGRSFA